MNKTIHKLICNKPLAAIVALAVSLLIAGQAQAVSVDINSLALYSGGNMSVDQGSNVHGDVAAVGNVGFNGRNTVNNVYAGNQVWVGSESSVQGNVLGNSTVSTGRNVGITGNTSGSGISMDRGASVVGDIKAGSSNISIGRNANITGNVQGNDNIWIDRNSTVTGNVNPGVGHSLNTGGHVNISGSTTPGTVTPDTFSPPSMGPAPASTIGTQNVWGGSHSTTSLSPGQYNQVGFGDHANLYLSAGEYTMSSFWMDQHGMVYIDTLAGDVTLNVHGDFSTDEHVNFAKIGDGDVFINVVDGGSFWLDDFNELEAAIAVYGGNFGIASNSTFTGTVQATGDVSVGANTNIYYSPSHGGGGNVPEPITLLSVSLGTIAAGLYMKRRRRQ